MFTLKKFILSEWFLVKWKMFLFIDGVVHALKKNVIVRFWFAIKIEND